LWLNTKNPIDIEYIEELGKLNDFVKIKRIDNPTGQNYSIREFYPLAQDADKIYIKMDDDIVFIAPDCLQNLMDCLLRNKDAFIVFANTVNNIHCDHIYQRMNVIPYGWGRVNWQANDPVGWGDPQFARQLHEYFLNNISKYELLKFPDWYLYYGTERVSINCICWFGTEFAKFRGEIHSHDDEQWLSADKPKQINKHNIICGSAVVCHYAYYTQRELLDKSDILEQYYQIAKFS
jgi:hypothetical protein